LHPYAFSAATSLHPSLFIPPLILQGVVRRFLIPTSRLQTLVPTQAESKTAHLGTGA